MGCSPMLYLFSFQPGPRTKNLRGSRSKSEGKNRLELVPNETQAIGRKIAGKKTTWVIEKKKKKSCGGGGGNVTLHM